MSAQLMKENDKSQAVTVDGEEQPLAVLEPEEEGI